jgi:phosphoribosylformimino-5-aminoimidazole carboxamide ribotide isomerase
LDFAKELETLGLKVLIYTDIKRDGMLSGPDIEGLKKILDSVKISVIASGGISNIEDVKKLYTLKSAGLIGAITGKAIYEGTLDLKEAIKLCSQKE